MATKTFSALRQGLILAMLCALPLGAQSGVYKWVDDDGTVHYSDTRPNNVKAESMKLQGVGSTRSGSGSPQQKAQAIDEAEQQRLNQEAKRLQEETAQREADAKCQVIRDNLQKIESTSRISIMENGERRYLNQEEIATQKAQYESMLAEHCS